MELVIHGMTVILLLGYTLIRLSGFDGPAKDKWPQNIASPGCEFYTTENTNSIPHTLEGIAEKIVVDQRHAKSTDRSRRMGMFLRGCDEQRPVVVRVYGFIKSCSLTGNGDWTG